MFPPQLALGPGPITSEGMEREMNAATLDKVRQRLLDRRAELTDELARMATEIKWIGDDQGDEGAAGNHMGDDGSNVSEAERLSTLSADLQDVLNQTESALERLDAGTYGICQRCGKTIGAERLEAFPFVTYCITCQATIERERALRFGH